MWKPKEIIVHKEVRDDPVTRWILDQCDGIPARFTESGAPNEIVRRSRILREAGHEMLGKIIAGKGVLYVAPAPKDVVDVFEMPDKRILCPHFERLKLASNGCFYQCDWCYLKLTFRANFPFITVRAQYERVKDQIRERLRSASTPIIFNSGELADSLSMEHLTHAAREFIPWFSRQRKGYLFMLTKSDNVKDILDLHHNGHTIVAWSLNNERVSRKFEIGAPPFEQRLWAARKVQDAGYPVRIRLDPIVPIDGWKDAYSRTIKDIFSKLSPERITVGTLRFEEGFYRMRNTLFASGPELPELVEDMMPMFPPMKVPGKKRPQCGKYSFDEETRIRIFRFAVREIRKYSDCPIALCKEAAEVWKGVGLSPKKCSCVCQMD